MTRATFLKTVSGILAVPEVTKDFAVSEIPDDSKRIFVLRSFHSLGKRQYENLQKQISEHPALKGLKVVILDEGMELSEVRPLGFAEIKRAIAEALEDKEFPRPYLVRELDVIAGHHGLDVHVFVEGAEVSKVCQRVEEYSDGTIVAECLGWRQNSAIAERFTVRGRGKIFVGDRPLES